MLKFSILFAAGVAGALVGLLSKPARPSKPRPAVRCFRIKRTKSELGFTFWILEGLGKHKCFVLFDTWREAMDEACRRLLQEPLQRPLVVEQPSFAVDAAPVSRERAACSDYAMAGHHQADRIRSVR